MIVCKKHLKQRPAKLLQKHISDGSHSIKNHTDTTEYATKKYSVCEMCIALDANENIRGQLWQYGTSGAGATATGGKKQRKTSAKKTTAKKPVKRATTTKKPVKRATTTKKPVKKIRKHQGVYQRGPKKGRLKPGFKYSGKKTKTGLKIIIKVKKK